MKKMNFYLSEPQVEYLEKKSEKLGITSSEIIRRVMDQHIAQEETEKLEKAVFAKDVTSIKEGMRRAKLRDESKAKLDKIKEKLEGE
jgi:predicted DNA-binding protein